MIKRGEGLARPQAPASKRGLGGRRVYEALREQILNLELQPGSDIDEGEMVKRFGVSRTPVREALIRLATDQLITLLPNRGARVSEVSLTSSREFFEALSLNQRAVNHWAALRATEQALLEAHKHLEEFEKFAMARDPGGMEISNREFHMALAECARNAYVARTYSELLGKGMRLARLAMVFEDSSESRRAKHLDGIISDHREMITAIGSGDAARAEWLGAMHTDRFRDRIIDYLKDSKGIRVSQAEPTGPSY